MRNQNFELEYSVIGMEMPGKKGHGFIRAFVTVALVLYFGCMLASLLTGLATLYSISN